MKYFLNVQANAPPSVLNVVVSISSRMDISGPVSNAGDVRIVDALSAENVLIKSRATSRCGSSSGSRTTIR